MKYPEITDLLPHRPPFLFVDKICGLLDGGKSIVCQLGICSGMPFFKGHFPGDAIMPGALIQEALAQTSGILLALSDNVDCAKGKIFYLASANVKFISPVRPGSVLTLKSTLAGSFGGLYKFSVEAAVERDTVASGSISLASSENAK